MKKYKIYYEYYPFDVEDLTPKCEIVEAESLTKAIEKLKEMKGAGKIEVFERPAREFYNEPE